MNLYLLHFCYDQLPPPTGQLENLGTSPLYMEQRHGRVYLGIRRHAGIRK